MAISKLKASSIASGTIDNARIPSLAASKIGSGTFADARIAASNVSQHATSFDDNKLVNDLSTLGLRVHTQENLSKSNTNSQYVDVFQDNTGIDSLTTSSRDSSEYVSSTTTTTINPTVSPITVSGGANNSPTFTINNATGLITHDHTSTTRDYDDNDIYGCRIDLGETKTITSDLYFQITDIFVDASNGNMGLCELNASTSPGSGYLFGSGGITPTTYDNAAGGSWDNLANSASYSAWYGQDFAYNGKYVSNAVLPAIVRYRWSENSGTISARYIDVAFANTWGRPKTFNIIHNDTTTVPLLVEQI